MLCVFTILVELCVFYHEVVNIYRYKPPICMYGKIEPMYGYLVCVALSHYYISELVDKVRHGTHDCDVFAFEHDLSELLGGLGLRIATLQLLYTSVVSSSTMFMYSSNPSIFPSNLVSVLSYSQTSTLHFCCRNLKIAAYVSDGLPAG